MKSKDKIKTALEIQPKVTPTGLPTQAPNPAKWGGVREGSGRPKGSTVRVSVAAILGEAEKLGKPFHVALMQDWNNSIENPDLRFKYNQLILNKVVADQHHIEVDDSTNLESKALAFVGALQALAQPTVPVITVDPDTDPE